MAQLSLVSYSHKCDRRLAGGEPRTELQLRFLILEAAAAHYEPAGGLSHHLTGNQLEFVLCTRKCLKGIPVTNVNAHSTEGYGVEIPDRTGRPSFEFYLHYWRRIPAGGQTNVA